MGLDYTNIPPLRDAIFEFTRSYSNWGSDYSVTGLLRPPREVMLTRRHSAEIDAMPFTHDSIVQNLKSFRGTAIHNHLEYMLRRFMQKPENKGKGYILERRIWDRIRDRKISGKFDCFLNGCLYDYKTTSVWKRIFGDWKDFEAQLNLYDYLLGIDGVEVTMMQIIAWYMDWDPEKIWKDPEYPKQEIELITIDNHWKRDTQKEYLYHRIDLMKDNEDRPDDDLDYCEESEMWAKPTVFAVCRPGQAKAVRAKGLTTVEKAEEYIRNSKAKDKDTFTIDMRPGERTKCKTFCKAAPFCNQYKAFLVKGAA